MEENKEKPTSDEKPAEPEAASLETTDDVDALEPNVTDATGDKSNTPAAPAPKKGGLKSVLKKFNLYLLLFVLILIIAGSFLVIAYFQSKKATSTSIKSQTLPQSSLQQVATTDASVGSSKQVLNVESNSVFAGSVLMRGNLQVAGDITLGGNLSLGNLSVSGVGSFGSLQASKTLSVAGDGTIQGQLTVAKNLQVTGSGSFSGPLTAPTIAANSLQLNGDLTLTHHITPGGAQPAHTSGPALGSGGTASSSGSDTAGSIAVNTGSGSAAGCFITINFSTKFTTTPHVSVTPVGAAGGGLAYYVERSSSGFSVCDATPPPSGASFGFDYFVTD